VAHPLQQGSLDAGVEAERTAIVGSGEEAAYVIFHGCQKDGPQVMLLGHVEKHELATYIGAYAKRLQ
jgi:hypothetical protein